MLIKNNFEPKSQTESTQPCIFIDKKKQHQQIDWRKKDSHTSHTKLNAHCAH